MKKIFFTLLAAAALVACSKNETAPVEQTDDIIRFTSNLRTYTVKAALDNETVKIVAGAPINQTVNAIAADGKLAPVTEMHWMKDQTAKTTFVSVYPADLTLSANNTIDEYDLVYEGAQNFDYHSGVLTATTKDVTPKTTVNFEYKHPFSMLLVTVDNQLEGTPDITDVKVSEVAFVGSLDLMADTVTPGQTLGAASATLKDGKYGVIIMPQSAKPAITVTVGEKSYKFVLNAAAEFKANKRYNAAITIKDNTPVIEEGEAVAFGFTVADWEDAEEALNYVDISEQWSVIGSIQGTAWDTDFVMEEGETPGLLEAEITYKAGEEFKLRKAASWDTSAGLKAGVAYVGDDAWNADPYLDKTDNNIKLNGAGVYKLTFNPANWAFTATKTGEVPADPEPDVTWVVVGIATDWVTEHEMTQDAVDPNLWTVDLTLGAADAEPGFKFRTKGDTAWAGHQFGMPADGDGAVTVPDGDDEVTVNLVADDPSSKDIVLRPAARVYTFKLYVAGDKKGQFTATLK